MEHFVKQDFSGRHSEQISSQKNLASKWIARFFWDM